MTEFNGYKLKPVDYKFKVGDILIKIHKDTDRGELALVTDLNPITVNSLNKKDWYITSSYWRAIETLPGSQAKAGDTVYCINNTEGSCNIHDVFEVSSISDCFIRPILNHTLRNGLITKKGWSWEQSHFIVLVKSEQTNYELDIPKESIYGWYVSAKGGFYYLRQDLTVQSSTGYGTTNSGYWPTEAKALAARVKYLGESMEQEIKVGSHWERVIAPVERSVGEIIKVSSVDTNQITWPPYCGLPKETFLKRFKPRPDLDNQVSYLTESNLDEFTPLETYNEFVIGCNLIRTGCSINGITKGKEYTLLGISIKKESGSVFFTIKDNNKQIRTWSAQNMWKLADKVSEQSENNINQQTEKQMPKLNLTLLIQFLAAQEVEQLDATNAKHIGILAESDGSYVGYVYANTLEELQDIVRKPENEGRKLHIFDYSTTLAQKPRKVIAVERT